MTISVYEFSCLYLPQRQKYCVAMKYRWIWFILDFERKFIFNTKQVWKQYNNVKLTTDISDQKYIERRNGFLIWTITMLLFYMQIHHNNTIIVLYKLTEVGMYWQHLKVSIATWWVNVKGFYLLLYSIVLGTIFAFTSSHCLWHTKILHLQRFNIVLPWSALCYRLYHSPINSFEF